MSDLSSLFESLLLTFKEKNWEKAALLFLLSKRWKEVVGDFVAKHTFPVRMTADTLVVGVDNHAVMQQLSFQRELVEDNIERVLGKRISVAFRIERLPRRARGRPSLPELPREKERELEELAMGVKDPELRSMMVRAMKRIERARMGRGLLDKKGGSGVKDSSTK